MGYTTDFDGEFTVSPPLNAEEISYLKDFSGTRRMDRENGPFFVKGEGQFGQGGGPDTIRNHNAPDVTQPGLWCQWVPTEDGTAIVWDGNEKFYESARWIKYLIDNLFSPKAAANREAIIAADERGANFTFNHIVNGTVYAQGEDPDDKWLLLVKDNEVLTSDAVISFQEPQPI
jgi:hypothetical protein